MVRKCASVVFVALLLSVAVPAWATAITVTAGQVVTVTFGTVPTAWDLTDPPDYLELYLGGWSSWLDGVRPVVDVALYDGDQLLGRQSHFGSMFGLFYGAGLEVRDDATSTPQQVDFTSLLDGTIDGRIELSFATGALVFDPATLPHPLLLWDVITPAGVWAARAEFAWLRDVRVDVTPGLTPVPEPGTLSLVATGLGIGWLRKRRQRRQEDAREN
jgi:hypothetical protein